jgi:hypothetical protein
MPRRVKYICEITDIYSGECTEYIIKKGYLSDLVNTINFHYGIPFTTHCGLANFLQRGYDGSPKRYEGIKITREF